jgi:hypothetical protein
MLAERCCLPARSKRVLQVFNPRNQIDTFFPQLVIHRSLPKGFPDFTGSNYRAVYCDQVVRPAAPLANYRGDAKTRQGLGLTTFGFHYAFSKPMPE